MGTVYGGSQPGIAEPLCMASPYKGWTAHQHASDCVVRGPVWGTRALLPKTLITTIKTMVLCRLFALGRMEGLLRRSQARSAWLVSYKKEV